MYLQQEQLEIDKHAIAVDVFDWYTTNYTTIDRRILIDAIGVGCISTELDEDGLVQPFLIDLGVSYCLWKCFTSYANTVDTDGNSYGVKALEKKEEYYKLLEIMTRSRALAE